MRRWTEQEKQFVRDNAATMTDKEMGEHINRSKASVHTWRYKNRVSKFPDSRRYSPWSEKEKDMLREYYYDAGEEKLKEVLPGRNLPSIKQKAIDMGLTRINSGRYTPNDLVKDLPEGTVTRCTTYGRRTYLFINLKERTIAYHRYRWMQEVGEIPDGYCLRCKTDETDNADPQNWELVKVTDLLDEYRHLGSRAGAKAFKEYRKKHGGTPAELLTDGFVAYMASGKDGELAEYLKENHPEFIRVARKNYKLKREINQINNG